MTVPEHPSTGTADSKLIRISLWVAIGALILAAIVCVVWVLVGTDNGVVGRAFLTILLLAAFAGAALLDARLAPRRPAWFALASMVTWVLCLLFGAILIWLPAPGWYYFDAFGRFISFLLIVLILLLALLHARLLIKAHQRHVTGFTRGVTIITIALVVILAAMLVIPLAFHEYFTYADPYWRAVVAIAILAAVGTALVPLVNALFAPRRPVARGYGPYPAAQTPVPPPAWPTYADGVTPLPVMPDGWPDWNAYYTGYPSTVSQAIAPVAPVAPVAPPHRGSDGGPAPGAPHSGSPAPGYEGYPPPPPLPPRP
ncbi:hypothetical protein G5T42_09960 [Microbacterium sp. 4R-513]|uniref:hypothetical protein n=1 Tax=Microbacterium sp. 4R-513 TaxID=2567934 RepID=UPI0013E16853|nr:hypothetical protein [Microbacterium sp. 4R-513]QIG39769.1 hypothetical protein G5T42_09960 [Microbacterium sp. 4R-513]